MSPEGGFVLPSILIIQASLENVYTTNPVYELLFVCMLVTGPFVFLKRLWNRMSENIYKGISCDTYSSFSLVYHEINNMKG